MNRIVRAAAATLLAIVLSACGGGQSSPDEPPVLTSASVATSLCNTGSGTDGYRQAGSLCLRSGHRLRALSSVDGEGRRSLAYSASNSAPLTSDELLNWAESNYPALFPAADRHTGTIGTLVSFRHYPATQNYLAISLETGAPAVYLYGAATNWQVAFEGMVDEFTCTVRGAAACAAATPKTLLLSEVGVALASTPSWTRLTRSLNVTSVGAAGVGWTAKSDRSWLTVTASGVTDSSGQSALSIQANVSGLGADTVNIATVTLSSSVAGVNVPEKLVVGVWKGSTTPSQIKAIYKRYQAVVADPVRPFVYAHNGTGTIDVYHLYKQSLEASIVEVGGVLGGMAVAPDGSRLYALDTANRAVASVDLATRTVGRSLALVQAASTFSGLAYARPGGVGLLVLGNAAVYSVSPWANLVRGGDDTTDVLYRGRSVTATLDGSKVALTGRSGATLYALKVEGDLFSMTTLGHAGMGNGEDAAFSRDGSRLYSASGYPYRCEIWDTADASAFGALTADAYPVSATVASDGRVYCGTDNDKADVWIYSPLGSLQKTLQFVTGTAAGLAGRGLAVSGDGLLLAALSSAYYDSDYALYLVPVGP